MTNDDFNPAIEDEASDSNQGRPILKIPSYKPASSSGGPGSSKNGADAATAAFAQQFAAAAAAAAAANAAAAGGSPGLLERASPAFSGTSSPTNSLIGKGMAVNFRDVIAKSISVKFQEGQSPGGLGELLMSIVVKLLLPLSKLSEFNLLFIQFNRIEPVDDCRIESLQEGQVYPTTG